jgi:hypothetical protein
MAGVVHLGRRDALMKYMSLCSFVNYRADTPHTMISSRRFGGAFFNVLNFPKLW